MPWTPRHNLSLRIALSIAPVFAAVLTAMGLLGSLREATLFTEDLQRDSQAVAYSVSVLLPQDSWEVAQARVAALDRELPWLSIRLVPLDLPEGPSTVEQAQSLAPPHHVFSAFYAETADRPVAVVVTEPLGPRDAFVARSLAVDAVAVLLSTGGASFFALLVGRHLVAARVAHLIRRLEQVARQEAVTTPLVLGDDELGALAREVNELAQQLDLARTQARQEAEARRRAQLHLRRAERLAVVGRTVAVLAHEVGTPLNVILGRAERLQANAQEETTQRAARAIAEQAGRLATFLRRLLDYGRHDDSFQLHPLDLRAPLEAAVGLLQAQARARPVVLDVRLSAERVTVLGDATSLQQVVTNLLTNAFDASPPGGTVTLRLEELANRARFTIEDQGPGFPPDLGAKVLEPFFTTKEAGAGTGLGLAVVREIVEDHGGRLTLDSAHGGGARVVVDLPCWREP